MVDTIKIEDGIINTDYLVACINNSIDACKYEINDLKDEIGTLRTQIEYNKGKIQAYENIKSEI